MKIDKYIYGCGDKSDGMLIIKNTPTALSAYVIWAATYGINGDMSMCFKCYCDENRRMIEKNRLVELKG